jgi:hypothetical protein
MRNVLIPCGLAAGLVLGFAASAGAVPLGAEGIKEAATASASASVQRVQYSEHRTRHGHMVKCYRDLVIGPYRCHWFPL